MERSDELNINPIVDHPQQLKPTNAPRTRFVDHFIYSEESDLDQWLKKHEDVKREKI